MPAAKKREPLPVGTTGYAKYKGIEYQVVAVSTNSGVAFMVDDKIYPSLSTAAKAVTGKETNGWRFWHLEQA